MSGGQRICKRISGRQRICKRTKDTQYVSQDGCERLCFEGKTFAGRMRQPVLREWKEIMKTVGQKDREYAAAVDKRGPGGYLEDRTE